MSFLRDIDSSAISFVDECIELQEIVTNLDKMEPQKAFEKTSKLSLFNNEDGISTIIENLVCVLRIRPMYINSLAKFCITFVDKSVLGTPSAEFGSMLLESLLQITSEDFYLSKVPEYTLLRALCEENLFSARDYLPLMSKLYSENFCNQFVLMFLILAPNLEKENPDFYNSVFPVLSELLQNGLIDSELVPIVKEVQYYKEDNWKYIKTCLKSEIEQKIVFALKQDNVKALKSIDLDPNMQITYTIFEPCAILRNEPTLLQAAAFYKAHESFKYLHSIGAKMHKKDSKDNTLAMYIVAGGDQRIVREVQRLNVSFKKTLPFAAAYRNYDLIEWIIEKRPKEVGDLNKEMRNVLTASAQYNNFRTFMSCLERGQNPRNRDRNNMNSLLLATKWRFYHFAQFVSLFECVDLNSADSDGLTALHYAAKNGDCSLISLLLDDGVKCNVKDAKGMTPLHYAACDGHVDAVKLLAEKTSSIDVLDSENRTPLFHACIHNFASVVDFLIKKGANKAAKDSYGKMPIHYCKDAEVANLFMAKK